MQIPKVGILSPGQMGHEVGRVLGRHGLQVFACLDGRSELTCSLAQEAGIVGVHSFDVLVREADLILSILVPAEAKNAANRIAEALITTKAQIVYVDCNAIAPSTSRGICEVISGTGSRFVDAGIIGPPPTEEGTTRFYASGEYVDEFDQLSAYGLDIRVLGQEIGQASGFKMTYAALTKGSCAIATELLIAACSMGLLEPLIEDFKISQGRRFEELVLELKKMPPKANRWVGEMEEIAKTFGELGLTPKIYQGVADIYRLVGQTEMGKETFKTHNINRDINEIIEIFTAELKQK